MKRKTLSRLGTFLYALLLMSTVGYLSAEGIPEPSRITLVTVYNTVGQSNLITTGVLEWTYKPVGGGNPIKFTAALTNINNQYSAVLFLPCESLLDGFSASSGTLIISPATTYDRSDILLDGKPVAFLDNSKATISLSGKDRGLIEPVSLLGTSSKTYHSADYADPRWVIDGSEMNRVLSYWRANSYHLESLGLDGYAAGIGNTNGLRHSADYRYPYWIIDGTEMNRVLSYWRAGGYHVDPAGLDGYAAGFPTTGQLTGLQNTKIRLLSLTPPVATHKTVAKYTPGSVIQVTNHFEFTGTLQSLLWRPKLPLGWSLGAEVLGDGIPQQSSGEIVFTAQTLNTPLQMVYSVSIPAGEKGGKQISAEVEYQLSTDINPNTILAMPNPLMIATKKPVFRMKGVDAFKNGLLTVSLEGSPGDKYEIQWSEDLMTWNPDSTLVNTNGLIDFTVNVPTEQKQRFYRIMVQP